MAKKDKTKKKAKENGKVGKNAVATIDWASFHKREKEREASGESGGNWLKRVKEADYPFIIKQVKLTTSNAGNKMFVITFIGKSGKVRGKQTRDYFTFTAESLFKLRSLLEAIDMQIPKKVGRLVGSDLEGKEVGISLGDEEYEGKVTSKPQDYMPIEDINADADEEEDDNETDGDEPEFDKMDLVELVAYNKKNKLGVKGLKNMKLKKARKAVAEAADQDEDLEEVDLDEM